MKEYWTDEETGIVHKILFDGRDYIAIDGDETIYLDAEDVYDEEDYEVEEEPLSEEDRWEIECDKRYHEMVDNWLTGGY